MSSSVYIHIPFCSSICSYCDFCKFYYQEELVDKYLNQLELEIKERYNKETIKTIYIGGGTPSILNLHQLKRLFNIIKIFNCDLEEFTFECNIEDIEKSMLKLLKLNGVNRISVGIQTLNDKYIKLLNRHHNKNMVREKINLLKKYFNNINIDLIYAIPGETMDELADDLNFILNLDVNHISTYSLIIEEHTKLYIDKFNSIDQDLDYEMYQFICNKLKENNFIHYEISNFSKLGYSSKHNLVYWNNLQYYGFGIGASGYLDNYRYDNTKSINHYLQGKYIYNINYLTLDEIIENEFILGLRKINGINKNDFFNKFHFDICSLDKVDKLLDQKKLIDDGVNVYINPDFLYISNDILIVFIG